jgi:hypothetical protein
MTLYDTFAILAGMLLVVGTPFAQQQPDLSGQWVVVSAPEGAGQGMQVNQDATTLTVDPQSPESQVLVYKLDGTEQRMVLRSEGSDFVSKAAWADNRLSITSTTSTPNGGKIEQKQVWSIDDNGRLTVEVENVRNGELPPMKMTMVYKRR